MASKKQSVKDRINAAEQWVNDYQPKPFDLGSFQKNLETGIALGHVAMGIDSKIATKHFKKKDLERPKIGPFPNKVRITAFTSFCKSYGCDERDIFRTVYLAEPKDQKDLDHVVRTLENLSSLIESKGGKQSRLIGISGRKKLAKSSDKNYKKGQAASYDTYGIVKHPNVAKSNWTEKQYAATHKSKPKATPKPTPKPIPKSTPKPTPKPWAKVQKQEKEEKEEKEPPKPPPPPAHTQVTQPQQQKEQKQKKQTKPDTGDSKDNPNKNKSFGFSAEQQQKQSSKYDMTMEKQVVDWINKCVGGAEGGGASNLQRSLKNGVILCKLANTVKPNSIKGKICLAGVGKSGAMANFADKQRINEFSRVVKSLGVHAASSFEADDLWEAKNMTAVLIGLYSFGSLCHKKKYPGAKGGIVGSGKKDNRGGTLYDMDSL